MTPPTSDVPEIPENAVKRMESFILEWNPYLNAEAARDRAENVLKRVLAGYRLVKADDPDMVCMPREPTGEMLDAGYLAGDRVEDIYAAMIAAQEGGENG